MALSLRWACQSKGWQPPQIQDRLSSSSYLHLVTASWKKHQSGRRYWCVLGTLQKEFPDGVTSVGRPDPIQHRYKVLDAGSPTDPALLLDWCRPWGQYLLIQLKQNNIIICVAQKKYLWGGKKLESRRTLDLYLRSSWSWKTNVPLSGSCTFHATYLSKSKQHKTLWKAILVHQFESSAI